MSSYNMPIRLKRNSKLEKSKNIECTKDIKYIFFILLILFFSDATGLRIGLKVFYFVLKFVWQNIFIGYSIFSNLSKNNEKSIFK